VLIQLGSTLAPWAHVAIDPTQVQVFFPTDHRIASASVKPIRVIVAGVAMSTHRRTT
jgi:hypothetical protein